MSYMRGATYVWDDGERIHIWAEDGRDGCLDSGWFDFRTSPETAAGVSLPMRVFDELVLMRYAELVTKGKQTKTAKRAIKKYRGNGGCEALEEWMGCKP